MKNFLKLVLVLLCFSSCESLFQFSPNEVRLEESEKDLNRKNIEKIRLRGNKDSLKFIVFGDTQRFYEEIDDFVRHANNIEELDFILLAGDISDFGLNDEFRWIAGRLAKLNKPFISVIGNHDMIANGRSVYREMFGAENFSFDCGDNKFICLNSNSLEVGNNGSVPNIPWLQQEIQNDSISTNQFIISHISPFSHGFDPSLQSPYQSLMGNSAKVRMSIHGHDHSMKIFDQDQRGFSYLVVCSVNKRNYALVTVWDDQYRVEKKEF